jgi:hypothetical protein
MTQPAKSQEPSMEEILASIRRIIADDDANKVPSNGPEPMNAEAPPAAAIPPPPMSSMPMPSAPSRVRVEPEAHPAPAPSNPPEPASVAERSSDIFDLTESMAAMPQSSPDSQAASVMPNPQFRTIDGNSDVGFDEESEGPMAAMPAPSAEDRGSLISKATTAAVDSAFSALAQTVLVQNARTLEDLVREMLRPMLKSWLDDNLPGLVERLVRAEIERVSRGRAG